MLTSHLKTCTRIGTNFFSSRLCCTLKNACNSKAKQYSPTLYNNRNYYYYCGLSKRLPFLNCNSLLLASRNKDLPKVVRKWVRRKVTYAGDASSAKVKVKLKREDLFRLLSLARPEKFILSAALGCLIFSSTITMFVPFAFGRILDTIFNKEKAPHPTDTQKNLKDICLILTGVFLVGALANFGRVYLFNSASLRIVQNLRAKLYQSMVHQETGWFDTKGTGELVNRLSSDTYLVGNSLSQNLSDGLRSTVMIGAGFGMMVYTSPELALVSSAVVPAIAGLAIIYGQYVRNITRALLDKFAGIMKSGEERLGNIKTVKIFCKEDHESQAYQEKLIDAMQLGYKEILAKATFFGLTGFSGNVIIISVLYYGGTLVTHDQLTIGALTSFILYAVYSAISLNGLSNFYSELNKGIGAAQRIWDIIDKKPEISVHEGLRPSIPPLGNVQFENVSFSFPSRPSSMVLRNLSFSLAPGTTTAVVGRSGCGKSTIATLLLRLYDPQAGKLRLDGRDLRELNPIWLRSFIGAVNQEPVLFSGTVKENILYGLNQGTTISDQELLRVVKEAHVDEFINRLPDGLETMVGQRGVMLSGGQKQRVAIARAIIKNPKILILDEATSALDAVSEELVQNALEKLSEGRTVLTIAHRLSTIRNADQIIVLENGEILEQGRYVDLISRENSVFQDLVRKQTFEIPTNFAHDGASLNEK